MINYVVQTNIGDAIARLIVIDGLHEVPPKDSAIDVYMRDVQGKKDDTEVYNTFISKSNIAYSKGAITMLLAAATDGAADTFMRDGVGTKDDTEQTTVVDTASLMRYQKAEIQELDQRYVPKVATASEDTNVYSNIIDITDKGILTGVSQFMTGDIGAGFDAIGHIKIILDGVTVIDDGFFTLGQFIANEVRINNNSLHFNHRFNTSLQVQHKVVENGGITALVYSKVSYTVKQP